MMPVYWMLLQGRLDRDGYIVTSSRDELLCYVSAAGFAEEMERVAGQARGSVRPNLMR